jgi:hypothetical protein
MCNFGIKPLILALAQGSLVPPYKISLGGPGWDKIDEQKVHLNDVFMSLKKMINNVYILFW